MSSETLLQGCQILRKKHEPWKQSLVRRGCGWAERLEVPLFLNQSWFEGPCLFFCLFVPFQSFSNLGADSPTIYLEGVAELGTVLESGKGKERASQVSSYLLVNLRPGTPKPFCNWQLTVFQFNVFCVRRNGPHPDIFSTCNRAKKC